MLAQPERVEADFLVETLSPMPATLAGVAPGQWRFYAAQLPSHPGWRRVAERGLVGQVRQGRLARLSQGQGEASLYRQVFDQVEGQYPDPDLDLAALTVDTEA